MPKRKPKATPATACDQREERLEEALEETFPASDPIAAGCPTANEPPHRPVDRKPPLIDADEVAAIARKKPASGGGRR